ncbi:MAG: hypothetical protein IT473_09265 [Lysobacter sp.]|nr:hypothetical protein [Lysobacter sp.]
MFGRISKTVVLAIGLGAGLSGCVTVYEYGGDAYEDGYYVEPSIDRYDYGYDYGNAYGPFYGRYYSPYYDGFGYRSHGSWFGNIGYSFGDGAFGAYGFPYWYFGYGYGYGHGYPYDRYYHRPYRGNYGNHGNPGGHRPPSHRPPGGEHRPPQQRPPGEHRPPRVVDRETPPWRRLQDVARPAPETNSAPRMLNGSMPRVRPQPATQARPYAATTSPSQTGTPSQNSSPPPPRPTPMQPRRFEQRQDSPAYSPPPAPSPPRRERPNASEREIRREPR